MKKVAFQTLGCRLNQMESEALASDFIRAGYEVVDFDAEADVYIINTCTVTNKAERKSRNQVNRADRHNTLTVVTGCSVNGGGFNDDSARILVSNEMKPRLFELIDSRLRGEDLSFDLPPDTFAYHMPEGVFRTRAAVKIQDGCDSFCSYCIIPQVRGAARSRSPEEIIEFTDNLINDGFREIVLTGVNIGRYQSGGLDFTGLLKLLLERSGDYRIRISSLEPYGLDDEFYKLFSHSKLCSHLHLCLQSGSDRILESMSRGYILQDFSDIASRIRQYCPDFCLTTDIIAGFPGETEEDFAKSLGAVRDLKISHVHAYPFSLRNGTAAEDYKDHIDEKVKTSRMKELAAVALDIKRMYRGSFIGKTMIVLSEKKISEGLYSGSSQYYGEVRFRADNAELNMFYQVKIEKIEDAGGDIVYAGTAEGLYSYDLTTR